MGPPRARRDALNLGTANYHLVFRICFLCMFDFFILCTVLFTLLAKIPPSF
jgi:hypothetical protein